MMPLKSLLSIPSTSYDPEPVTRGVRAPTGGCITYRNMSLCAADMKIIYKSLTDFRRITTLCSIWGSRNGGYEEFYLLEYNTV
jgi:hypothetical protein